ncbi:MAG: NAD(P)-dependent alcohol dehydrogenase [Saprospiraceae bacterium]
MKAAIRTTYGLPEDLSIQNIVIPTPKDHEVLIRVHATTVNRTDCAILTGKPYILRLFTGLVKPTLPTPGSDFAGQIEAIGKAVTNFKAGDKVWGFDDNGLGSQGQYMTLSANKAIITMPENCSYAQAAASAEAAHYAYNFINKVNLKPGQKVLVNGATGGIGSAAVQMLVHLGVQVTAVANTKNLELVQSLGAIRVMDYTKEDFTRDTEKYDFIFDAVGKSTFGKCKHLLKPNGIYISSELGPGAQNPFLALFTPMMGGKKVIFPLPSDIKGSLVYIKNLIELGKFKPVIEREYPLEEIAEAYRYVASGQKTGNVVIDLNH